MTPAVNYELPVTFVEDVDQGSEGITEAVLKILPSQDCKVTALYQWSKFLVGTCHTRFN